MGQVVDLNCITTLPIPTERVLQKASSLNFERVVIIGVLEDGGEYFASSEADGGCILWDMERAKFKLMNIAQEATE
jgi:hypothetical protein